MIVHELNIKVDESTDAVFKENRVMMAKIGEDRYILIYFLACC